MAIPGDPFHLFIHDRTAKSHQVSFPPEYMGVFVEQTPPYIPAEVIV